MAGLGGPPQPPALGSAPAEPALCERFHWSERLADAETGSHCRGRGPLWAEHRRVSTGGGCRAVRYRPTDGVLVGAHADTHAPPLAHRGIEYRRAARAAIALLLSADHGNA